VPELVEGTTWQLDKPEKKLYYIVKLKNKNVMTRFESIIFDLVENAFGTKAAMKNYCFWSNAATAFMYMCYLFTLPFKFVKLFWRNLKEKGVI
jgi:hypothetical protein